MSKRTTQFAPPPSQLDNIPEGYPVVFISYAWDDEDHKKWVKKLADDLRNNGVYSLLDQYNPKGESLTKFMVNGIEVADRVLVIGSPRYKEKIDNPKDHSGVKFEATGVSVKNFTFAIEKIYNNLKIKVADEPVRWESPNGEFGYINIKVPKAQ